MILQVDDPHDPRLEPYRHVGNHQWLRERGLFVAEGRLVFERLCRSSLTIHSALLTPAALTALAGPVRDVDAPVHVAPQAVLDGIAGFNFHRGCLALGWRPAPRTADSFKDASLMLGLEGVGDPDNLGGLFRTAAAFGAAGLLLDARSGDPFYRKAVRTSMGAVLSLPFGAVEAWAAEFPALRSRGVRVVALTPAADAVALDEVSRRGPGERMLLMVGAEGAGLSPDVLAAADVRVRIPMAHAIDSLNVVVAAGVALSRLATIPPAAR